MTPRKQHLSLAVSNAGFNPPSSELTAVRDPAFAIASRYQAALIEALAAPRTQQQHHEMVILSLLVATEAALDAMSVKSIGDIDKLSAGQARRHLAQSLSLAQDALLNESILDFRSH
ncbi:MAG: hypothetical protein CMF76_09350 [Maricaulis sp.]|jgi:hypothetical protein|nr:hypothetical protein [Oceanicaulis sp.]MAZ92153.1 hypothetical protein [Maricaulis sp.]|tara:strand:- start:142 stop:492 length:351 start_codon:yes stop_codon:yes gene_type:complete